MTLEEEKTTCSCQPPTGEGFHTSTEALLSTGTHSQAWTEAERPRKDPWIFSL